MGAIPSWLERLPHPQSLNETGALELIAHRGMPRKMRENTLAGFALALAAGVDGIELDVHATRDGGVVVHHDPRLQAAPGGPPGVPGPVISAMTLAQIRGETFGGGDVPTLDECLALVDGRAMVYVEIKAPGIEDAVVEKIRKHGVRAAVHSFDHRVSRRVRALAPSLPTGILSSSYLIEPERALLMAEARDFWQWWEMIDRTLVERIHEARGRVIAWTVNTPVAVTRLAVLGVDAVCTDVPDEIGALVRGGAAG